MWCGATRRPTVEERGRFVACEEGLRSAGSIKRCPDELEIDDGRLATLIVEIMVRACRSSADKVAAPVESQSVEPRVLPALVIDIVAHVLIDSRSLTVVRILSLPPVALLHILSSIVAKVRRAVVGKGSYKRKESTQRKL